MTDREVRQRFHRAVDTTLSGLEGDSLLAQRIILQARPKEEAKMKRKLSVGLVIVLALLLMSVTALAAGLWGIVDFTGRYGTRLLDSAADTVQTGIVQQGGKGESAIFTLREAICDGQAAYLVFDVTPTDEHTLLIMDDLMPNDPAVYLGKDYPEDMTVAEYARSQGFTQIIRVYVDEQRDEDGQAAFTVVGEGGVLTDNGAALGVTAQGRFSDPADVAFTCLTINTGTSEIERIPLTATLRVDAPLWVVSTDDPVDYPEAGVRIDSVEMTGTVMGIYSYVTFTVTDQERYDGYDGGFWLEILDENGEKMPSGALAQGSMSDPDQNGQAHYVDSLQAVAEAPATIGIRAYSAWTKERCKPVPIGLGE